MSSPAGSSPLLKLSDSSMKSNTNDSTKIRFIPTIPKLHDELWSSSFRDERIFRFDTSGTSRRVVDWSDAAESRIQASIHKAIKAILHTHKRIDNQKLIENVGAAYDPLGKIAYELGTSADFIESFDREDFLLEVGNHYRASNKSNSLDIYIYLEFSDLTDAIKALDEYLQHAPASGSRKSGKSFSSSKSGKGSLLSSGMQSGRNNVALLSRGMQSGRNNASPVQMFVTTGANLVKSAKRSIASRRSQQPEQVDAIKSQVDVARSVGSTASSLRRNPVSSPSPAVSTPSRISGGLPSSSSSVPIVRDTAVDTSQVPTTPVPSVRTRSCSQNMCHLEMHFLAVLLS